MTFLDNRPLCKKIRAKLIIMDNYQFFDHFRYYLNISRQSTCLVMIFHDVLGIIHNYHFEMTIMHNEQICLLIQ